jgi:hypothetical protein
MLINNFGFISTMDKNLDLNAPGITCLHKYETEVDAFGSSLKCHGITFQSTTNWKCTMKFLPQHFVFSILSDFMIYSCVWQQRGTDVFASRNVMWPVIAYGDLNMQTWYIFLDHTLYWRSAILCIKLILKHACWTCKIPHDLIGENVLLPIVSIIVDNDH